MLDHCLLSYEIIPAQVTPATLRVPQCREHLNVVRPVTDLRPATARAGPHRLKIGLTVTGSRCADLLPVFAAVPQVTQALAFPQLVAARYAPLPFPLAPAAPDLRIFAALALALVRACAVLRVRAPSALALAGLFPVFFAVRSEEHTSELQSR